uniref:Uncharacterized protein n=1 Tax=Aegilops tauschii subsp. strangulata TaxID=200361 RepID=A0A453K4E2_AEGTS
TTWSNLAHEMTAEFRSLCAEEGISATGVREATRYEEQSQARGGTVGRTYLKLIWTEFTFGI